MRRAPGWTKPTGSATSFASSLFPDLSAPELGVVGRGKAEGESRQQPRLASYADPAAVQLGDRLDDGEAQARARRGLLARAARPVEAVEDARQVLRRDPRAGVGHRDPGRSVRSEERRVRKEGRERGRPGPG